MIRKISTIAVMTVALFSAGCASSPTQTGAEAVEWRTLTTAEEFRAAVVGRPLTYDNGLKLVVTPEGGFESPNRRVSGRWSFENGVYCREIAIEDRTFPEECHAVQITSDGARFRGVNADGTPRSAASIGA